MPNWMWYMSVNLILLQLCNKEECSQRENNILWLQTLIHDSDNKEYNIAIVFSSSQISIGFLFRGRRFLPARTFHAVSVTLKLYKLLLMHPRSSFKYAGGHGDSCKTTHTPRHHNAQLFLPATSNSHSLSLSLSLSLFIECFSLFLLFLFNE